MIKEDEKRLFRALITEKDRDQRNEILDNTGIPEKRLSFILIKWSGRDIWSYGTHEFGGWFEEDGFMDEKNRPWLLELIEPLTILQCLQIITPIKPPAAYYQIKS
jgi:hypothetical protein